MTRVRSAFPVLLLIVCSCSRERRDVQTPAPQHSSAVTARQDTIIPGGYIPAITKKNPYEGNAFAISEGHRLFVWYNCVGCHANGGGAIGPPLINPDWIYGREPENIYETIVKGRPKGMPAWGGRIPDYQIWQLVTYVRSIGGSEPASATPGRNDALQKTQEQTQ